uniref:BAR/IMD domain-containing adapter protein 2-like n=1 Tax=Pristiophorus japonicus TaxID=55135 RepID=UPI00398F5B90
MGRIEMVMFEFVELISQQQCEMDLLVAKGYRTALVEERRRYCYLVDRQCAVSKQFSLYHVKVKDLLSHKLVAWQNSCVDPGRIPERAMTLVKQTATNSTGPLIVPTSPAVKTLGSTPDQDPPMDGNGLSLSHRSSLPGPRPVPNGEADKASPMEVVSLRVTEEPAPACDLSPVLPPPPKAIEVSSNTLPSRKKSTEIHRPPVSGEHRTLPRPPPSIRAERPRVRAAFSHAAGDNETLLSFEADEVIALLVPEAKDGWHYGESEVTRRKGWFPFSYTRPLQDGSSVGRPESNLQASKFNSSSTGRLDKVTVSPEPGLTPSSRQGNSSLLSSSHLRPRPYSMMNPDLSQLGVEFGRSGSHSPRNNPFANIRLKRTVTNDRSAPAIR